MHTFSRLAFCLAAMLLAAATTEALEPAAMFSDHMVLQREMPVPIWGTGRPGEKITVTFRDQKALTRVDDKGQWLVKLAPLQMTREPQQLTIAGDSTVTFKDVLVGEVWFGGGQSNMVGATRHKVDHPNVRFFAKNRWTPAVESVFFSERAGHFAILLKKELEVPVGVYSRAIGGASVKSLLNTHQDCAPYAIRGVFWDQGESGPAKNYPEAMADLMGLWRRAFDNPGLVFILAQKPSGGGATCDLDDPWLKAEVNGRALLPVDPPAKIPPYYNNFDSKVPMHLPPRPPRKEEPPAFAPVDPIMPMHYLHGFDKMENVFFAQSLDLGAGIHPGNGEGYARRAVRVALARVYGKDIVPLGPRYVSHRIEDNRVEVKFDSVGKGLRLAGPKQLNGFVIAGEDKALHWAQAKITGKDSVEVWSDQVAKPVAIRYGWAVVRPWANLFNSAGLPAMSFRTDTWVDPAPPKADRLNE